MLRVLVDGVRSSAYKVNADVFTKDNSVSTSSRINNYTPKGVLGGSVAGIVGDYEVGAATTTTVPVGLFVNNATPNVYDNNAALASGKIAVIRQMATVEVDVYETKDAAGSSDLVYAAGDLLYASKDGLLTKEKTGDQQVVGVCIKAPTGTDPFMGVDLRV